MSSLRQWFGILCAVVTVAVMPLTTSACIGDSSYCGGDRICVSDAAGQCTTNGCAAGFVCVDTCETTPVASCAAKSNCYSTGLACYARADLCGGRSTDTCAAEPSCVLKPQCVPTRSCYGIDGRSECTSLDGCLWQN